jgi:hypothetical protein
VFVEAGQAFAERTTVYELAADFGAAAQGRSDGLHRIADLDLLAVEQQQDGTEMARDGTAAGIA